ncbi:MAG: lysylphosphatidylglycerol synthase transmembrane domain-containing protein [Bradymonadia bacterium]
MLVSALLLWAISRLFDLDFLTHTLAEADLQPLLIAFPFSLLVMLIRGVRFRAAAPVAPLRVLIPVMGLKNGLARITPFRAGELYTLYLLKRHADVAAPKTLVLIIWLKLVDLAVIVSIFTLGVMGRWASGFDDETLLWWALAALGGLLALVYGFAFWLRLALKPLRALGGSSGFVGKVLGKLDALAVEMAEVGPGRTTTVLLCTVVLWSCQLVIVTLILRAFGIDLPVQGVALGFGATQAALILPLPSVASVGPLEAGWVAGFTAVGVPKDLAAVTGLAANGILLAYALLIAAGCWLWLWRFSTHQTR